MTLAPEVDLGTPRGAGPALVTATVDGREVSVPAGTSVLRAASEAGVDIPRLCATDSLAAFGSCRLCLVEIDGVSGTPASCTTPCTDGMVVTTRSDQLAGLRRGVMELYLSDHPADCPGCARGSCEMQRLAHDLGVTNVRYGLAGASHVAEGQDLSNPYFAYDPAACIVCSRCVRACGEIQGTFALTVAGRGFDSRITPGGWDFLGSECVSCGACVQACPTSALEEKSLAELGMPSRAVETTCAYCGVGCSFRAEVHGEGADTTVVRMVPSGGGGDRVQRRVVGQAEGAQLDLHPHLPEPADVSGHPGRGVLLAQVLELAGDVVGHPHHGGDLVHRATTASASASTPTVDSRAVATVTWTAVTLYSGQFVAQSELSVVTTLAPLTGWWKVV